MLAFSTDTLANGGLGFRRAEVRTAYLVYYATADFQQPTDTLRQPTGRVAVGSTKPVLVIYYGAGYPPQFAVAGYSQPSAPKSFRLVVPAATRQYDIGNIILEESPGKSRCDGYRITRREATVNGQRVDGISNPPELTK